MKHSDFIRDVNRKASKAVKAQGLGMGGEFQLDIELHNELNDSVSLVQEIDRDLDAVMSLVEGEYPPFRYIDDLDDLADKAQRLSSILRNTADALLEE